MKALITTFCFLTVYIMASYQGLSALEDTFSFAKTYEVPLREQSIIVTSEGYYPKSISAFVGERMRFFVTSTTGNNECFILRDKNLFLSAQKGKISEGEVIFSKAGKIDYYCPTGNLKGHIMVLNKPDKQKREIASDKNVRTRVWRPRED